MALPFDVARSTRDQRSLAIVAKTVYRELRAAGYDRHEIVSLASELLALVTSEFRQHQAESS